jgi:hypothetical protein
MGRIHSADLRFGASQSGRTAAGVVSSFLSAKRRIAVVTIRFDGRELADSAIPAAFVLVNKTTP